MLVDKKKFFETINQIPTKDSHVVFFITCSGTGEGFGDLLTKEFLALLLWWRNEIVERTSQVEASFVCALNNGNVLAAIPKRLISSFRESISSVQCRLENTNAGISTIWDLLQAKDISFLHKIVHTS